MVAGMVVLDTCVPTPPPDTTFLLAAVINKYNFKHGETSNERERESERARERESERARKRDAAGARVRQRERARMCMGGGSVRVGKLWHENVRYLLLSWVRPRRDWRQQ